MRTIRKCNQQVHLGAQINEVALFPASSNQTNLPSAVDRDRREEADAGMHVTAIKPKLGRGPG